MAYVIKVTIAKPEKAVWFSKSGATAKIVLANIAAWTRSMPGFISSSEKLVNKNTVENVVVFDTKAHGDSWLVARATQPDCVVQEQYFSANGITTTIAIL